MNSLSLDLPRLAIALGDPMGIGPEVVLKALADPALTAQCEITVVGSRSLLCDRYEALRAMIPANGLAHPETLNMVEIEVPPATATQLSVGYGNAASGAVSFWTLERAIALALAGAVEGVVTAPISKAAWNAAGYHYPGQTELLAQSADSQRFGMLFVARSPHTGWTLRTLLATTHIPLRQVPDALTPALMTLKLELLVECLQRDFGLERPTIAIAGLNPHSGEQGQLGREELDWLIPWMQDMGDRLPQVRLEGPVPPDTLWVKPGQAWFGTAAMPPVADGYLALYHDQGLIPVKLMAFDRAVNTTIGLPFIRTSPDHGTAFDIATQGVADSSSMTAAIQLGIELALQHRRNRVSAQIA